MGKKSRHIWANLSGGAIKSNVGLYTRRRGRKDHLETSDDIRLSVNYSNKHAGEWHLVLDVSPVGTVVDAFNSNKEL